MESIIDTCTVQTLERVRARNRELIATQSGERLAGVRNYLARQEEARAAREPEMKMADKAKWEWLCAVNQKLANERMERERQFRIECDRRAREDYYAGGRRYE